MVKQPQTYAFIFGMNFTQKQFEYQLTNQQVVETDMD